MRFLGRGLLVCLVVCLGLFPTRAEAATITIPLDTLSAGSFDFSETFDQDNDVALISFSLSAAATVSIEMTSQTATPAGFDPILTLFRPGTDFMGSFDRLSDSESGMLDALLSAGDYLLAITQYNNFYVDGENRFDFDAALNGAFTKMLFDPLDTVPCGEFVAFDFTADAPECRTAAFAGSLTVEPELVPEPGAIVLLALGGTAMGLRRRHRKRRPWKDAT